MDETRTVSKMYQKMSEIKKYYGEYHKTLFHLHTPASHDYKLRSIWEHEDYCKSEVDDLIELCVLHGIVPEKDYLEQIDIKQDHQNYTDKKEWLSYLLIANAIIQNDYEIVVVTDHNTISGIDKLSSAVKELHKMRKNHPFPVIVNGVEISCADKLHVVGIFDESNRESVQKWLENNLINEKDGTYLTSLDVMSFFKKEIPGISYIAHINSSQLFSDGKYLSGAYKKKLQDENCYQFIGIHEISQKQSIEHLLSNHKINTKGVVIDNDSHDIDGMADNFFWVKSGKRSFKTLKEAFDDYDVSVSLTAPGENRKYIKSVLIENGGFLSSENGEDFSMALSDSLNCFIGGRGTGKSTILQLLDYAMGVRVPDEHVLDFICQHGNIWILFVDGAKEYLIRMSTPVKQQREENILRYFGQNEADLFNFRYRFDKDKISDYLVKNYLSIFEVLHDEGQGIIIKTAPKRETLNRLYDIKYSVNELVQTAGGDKIDSFIRQLMFQNKSLSSPDKTIRCRSKKGLSKAIDEMKKLMEKRKSEVEEVIVPFNKKMSQTLRIVYKQNKPIEEPDFEEWIFMGKKPNQKRQFEECDISESNVIEYLYNVNMRLGTITLLRMALKLDDRYQCDITDFLDDNSLIGEEGKKRIVDAIFDRVITDRNYSYIIEYLRRIVRESEQLSLEFNINSKTTATKNVEYKDVRNLSLGQKVVAMLDFIFGYGDFVDDNRPVIIDQPEDNLDSQYIYHNLVKQLREIKNNRQVIIATHSATIVTNAMADMVCVMNSDGKNGWIERAGYPSEDKIKKDIINYMEGGVPSFKHKISVYSPVLSFGV